MVQKVVAILFLSVGSFSYAAEIDRFSLKGTITAGPNENDSVGVAMINDRHTGKTFFVKIGQPIAGSPYILTAIHRKSVVLRVGNQEMTLYRNAWDENQETVAQRSFQADEGFHANASFSDQSDRIREGGYSDHRAIDGDSDFHPPPVPPPVNYGSEGPAYNDRIEMAYPVDPLNDQVHGPITD